MRTKKATYSLSSFTFALLATGTALAQNSDPTFNGLFNALQCIPSGLESACNNDYCVAYPAQAEKEGFIISLEKRIVWTVNPKMIEFYGYELTDDPNRVRAGYALAQPPGSRLPISINYISPSALNAELAVEFNARDKPFNGTLVFSPGNSAAAYSIFFSIKNNEPLSLQSGGTNLGFTYEVISGTCQKLNKQVNWN